MQMRFIMPLLALALALPFVLAGYQVFQATMVLVYALALMGLVLLTGLNGQVSLGHGAFFAVGAYAAGMLMEHAGWPWWATLPAAALAGLVLGVLFGLPALRLEGLYLALATFALGVVTPQLLKHKRFEAWTGGNGGLVLIKPEAPFGLKLNADQWLYFVTLAITVVMYVAARRIVRGDLGRAMRAVRDHPLAAETMGVHNARIKTLTFGLSALYTSLAGALGAIAVQFVAPDTFSIFLSITLLVGAVVGGVNALSGALWGAIFIQFVPGVAEKLSKAAPWAVYGVILLLLMFFLPGGVADGLARLRARFTSRSS